MQRRVIALFLPEAVLHYIRCLSTEHVFLNPVKIGNYTEVFAERLNRREITKTYIMHGFSVQINNEMKLFLCVQKAAALKCP